MAKPREIGDIRPLRETAELLVYFHLKGRFCRITQDNFLNFFPKGPKYPKGPRCLTCPKFYVKYNGKETYCQTRMESFMQFKNHLSESERIFGELIAFKIGSKLPDVSIYNKHRWYGYLWPFQKKDEFFIFDTFQKKFTKIKKKKVAEEFIKKGLCNYCPCNRKLQSSTTVIKHLQVLETRFFCYLMLEDQKYNDEKNQERLKIYLNYIKTGEINDPNLVRKSRLSLRSYKSNGDNSKKSDLEMDEISECESNISKTENEEEEENPIKILDRFRDKFAESYERIESYFDQLKINLIASDLNQGIIDSQETMQLIKRNEDFQDQTKDFMFLKSINLSYEDLDYLMNKYGIADSLEIDNAHITLNLKLKEEINLISKDIKIPIKKLDERQLASKSSQQRRPQFTSRSMQFTMDSSKGIKEIIYENDDDNEQSESFCNDEVYQNDFNNKNHQESSIIQSPNQLMTACNNLEISFLSDDNTNDTLDRNSNSPKKINLFKIKKENCFNELDYEQDINHAKRIKSN